MEHDRAGSGRRRPDWLRPDLGLGRNNGLLFWAYLVWGAGFTLQIALWTIFIESLGATPAQIGLVVGGGAVVRTLLAIPAGSLADRFPLKPVMVGMMGIPILGAAGLAVATEWWHALAGAVLMDLSAVGIPATSAYIAAAARPEERTRAMTYIFNISGLLTMIVAPAIGGWLAQEAGFRVVYIVGAVLFAGGIAIVALIDDVRPAAESSDGDSAGPQLGYRDLLRLPGIRVVLGFHLAVPLFAFTGVALLPNFLKDERGLSVATIGVLASLGSIAAFGAS
ncbi:MAG: MFS transporter, partial [Vicinamibacterales bacterium]